MKIKFAFLIFFLVNMVYSQNVMNLFIAVNYLADDTINDFQKNCNCKLQQSFFNDPNEMLAKISAGSTGYDVIEATSYAVEELVKMDKLQPLIKNKIVGFNNIDNKFINPQYDPNNVYSIPYAFTPVFLAYNVKKMQELNITPNSWGVIFEEKDLKKLKGHITVFSSSRNVFAAALLYLHKDPNTTNINDLKQARQLIEKASKYWTKFDTDSYYRGLIRGDIWIAMSYSIDIYKTLLDLRSFNSNIQIAASLQKEGNMYEMDNLVIPKGAKHIDYAYQFLNTTLDPKHALELAKATGSSIPNKVAFEKLSPALKQIPWIYPPKNAKVFTFNAYDPKTRILVNEMWTEIQMYCGKNSE